MFANNPFSILAESVSPILMQSFVILMGLLVIAGTLMDIIHKKNVKYFFLNAKKAKKSFMCLFGIIRLWKFDTGYES